MAFRSRFAVALSAQALLFWASGSYGQAVEAESGATFGSASIYADPAASGGRGVAYISSSNSGFRLRDVPAASGVRVRYASELSGALSVFVDGTFAGALEFSSTGAWVGTYDVAFLPAPISEGADFEMVFLGGDTAMNIDFVEFTGPVPGTSGREPSVEPKPLLESPPSSAVFGIDSSGNLFHVDEGWTAGFHYLCVNGVCFPGTRADGVFQRDAAAEVGVGETVRIQFKVEDNGGQCLTGEVLVTRQPGLTPASSLCASAVGNSVPVSDPVAAQVLVPASDPRTDTA